jgi:hypothetical protein
VAIDLGQLVHDQIVVQERGHSDDAAIVGQHVATLVKVD